MCRRPDSRNRPAERGSVLIYIFIAIAAFAALSFAVSRNSREGLGTVDRERSELLATQILDYTGMIRRSVQSMTVDGIDAADICFDTVRWGHTDYDHPGCTDPEHQIFNVTGGGAIWQDMADDIFDIAHTGQPAFSQWVFSGANAVTQVGSDCSTPGDAACNELLMVLPYIKRSVCLALNKRLQVTTADTVPVDNADFDITTEYKGFVNGKVLDTALLHGKRSGCFEAETTPADGSFAFFAVLIAR